MTVDEVEALLDRLMDVVNQAGWGATATYDIHDGYVTLVIDAVPTVIEETA